MRQATALIVRIQVWRTGNRTTAVILKLRQYAAILGTSQVLTCGFILSQQFASTLRISTCHLSVASVATVLSMVLHDGLADKCVDYLDLLY